MNKLFNKQSIMAIVVIVVISLVSGGILAVVNEFTKPDPNAMDTAAYADCALLSEDDVAETTNFSQLNDKKNTPFGVVQGMVKFNDGTLVVFAHGNDAYQSGKLGAYVAIKDGIIVNAVVTRFIDGSNETAGDSDTVANSNPSSPKNNIAFINALKGIDVTKAGILYYSTSRTPSANPAVDTQVTTGATAAASATGALNAINSAVSYLIENGLLVSVDLLQEKIDKINAADATLNLTKDEWMAGAADLTAQGYNLTQVIDKTGKVILVADDLLVVISYDITRTNPAKVELVFSPDGTVNVTSVEGAAKGIANLDEANAKDAITGTDAASVAVKRMIEYYQEVVNPADKWGRFNDQYNGLVAGASFAYVGDGVFSVTGTNYTIVGDYAGKSGNVYAFEITVSGQGIDYMSNHTFRVIITDGAITNIWLINGVIGEDIDSYMIQLGEIAALKGINVAGGEIGGSTGAIISGATFTNQFVQRALNCIRLAYQDIIA